MAKMDVHVDIIDSEWKCKCLRGFEEESDEYQAEYIFWFRKKPVGPFIMDNAKDEKIGQYIDDAMILVENENTSMKGIPIKRYDRPEIDKRNSVN